MNGDDDLDRRWRELGRRMRRLLAEEQRERDIEAEEIRRQHRMAQRRYAAEHPDDPDLLLAAEMRAVLDEVRRRDRDRWG